MRGQNVLSFFNGFMKIKIIYNFNEGPTGGGNQFLKALKKDLAWLGFYTEKNEEADVFLFNSYHNLKEVLFLKKKFPEKVFLHRLGPLFYLHRGKHWKLVDKSILNFSQKVSAGFIFQSNWSLIKAKAIGFKAKDEEAKTILNWPDKQIFYPLKEKVFFQSPDYKIKLISASWSTNFNKGFSFYRFLDEKLDFKRYEMTFLGNKPKKVDFKNIKYIPALPSTELAKHLRQGDIFITAAQDEACSNALIEAIACGLRVLALNSGSNSEIVGSAGELFQGKEDFISKLDLVRKNYFNYAPIIKSSSKDYLDFIEQINLKKTSPLKTRQAFIFRLGLLFSFSRFVFFNLLCKVIK